MSTKSSTLAGAISATTSLLATPTNDPFPFPSIPDDPESANRNCRLLGPFSLFIQAIMGFVVVGSLVLKRQREKPKRPWKIWLLDISKQMIGQLFVHTLNVLLSSLGSLASEGENNPCSLYFLNIAIDTTLGVLFIYFSMRYLTHYFTDVLGWPGFVSGQYISVPSVLGRRKRRRNTDPSTQMEDSVTSPTSEIFSQHEQDASIHQVVEGTPAIDTTPTPGGSTKKNRPRLTFFFRQLSLYLLSLLLMKIMVVLMFVFFPFLFDVGRWVLNLFGEHRKTQIFFVMAIFPLAMNTLQFWLIDSLLRHNPLTSIYKSEEDERNANDGINGSESGGGGYFGSAQGGEGQTGSRWWQRSNGQGDDQHRQFGTRNNEGSRARLMDDLGDDDHDNSSRSDDVHAYPPTPSVNSSVGQLDTQAKSTLEDASKGDIKSQLHTSSDVAAPMEQRENSSSRHVISSQEEEEEDAWDNWDEDRDKRKSVEH